MSIDESCCRGWKTWNLANISATVTVLPACSLLARSVSWPNAGASPALRRDACFPDFGSGCGVVTTSLEGFAASLLLACFNSLLATAFAFGFLGKRFGHTGWPFVVASYAKKNFRCSLGLCQRLSGQRMSSRCKLHMSCIFFHCPQKRGRLFMQPFQCDLQPHIQETHRTTHTGTTTRCRTQRRNQNDPSHNRRTQEVPFIHRRPKPLYTEKHKVSCSGFLPSSPLLFLRFVTTLCHSLFLFCDVLF